MTSANIANFGAAAYTGSVQIMDNQLVEGGNGSWSYSPLKYWPQSGALYFSAYAPYATADNGITPSYNTTTRTFDLSYALPADEDDQVDLLMAANVDVADCASRPLTVQFTFGHILSRVGLTARYSGSVTTGTTVTLTDVKISGKFVASGDYTVSGGWDNRSASASTIIYDRPAAKLAQSCYSNMFSGCTSLTTAPTLPATTLSNSCYYRMFSGCSSLSAVTCLATDISATDCTSYWLTGAASIGTFTKATSMTSWSRGYRGIPSGWTVQDAQ